MASVERTAYPRFRRFMSARELHVFYTSAAEEIEEAARRKNYPADLINIALERLVEDPRRACARSFRQHAMVTMVLSGMLGRWPRRRGVRGRPGAARGR